MWSGPAILKCFALLTVTLGINFHLSETMFKVSTLSTNTLGALTKLTLYSRCLLGECIYQVLNLKLAKD